MIFFLGGRFYLHVEVIPKKYPLKFSKIDKRYYYWSSHREIRFKKFLKITKKSLVMHSFFNTMQVILSKHLSRLSFWKFSKTALFNNFLKKIFRIVTLFNKFEQLLFFKSRNSHQRCSVKKGVLSFLVFSCEFCENSKDTFFHRTPLVAASINSILQVDFSVSELDIIR